jgi:hypothetical protein
MTTIEVLGGTGMEAAIKFPNHPNSILLAELDTFSTAPVLTDKDFYESALQRAEQNNFRKQQTLLLIEAFAALFVIAFIAFLLEKKMHLIRRAWKGLGSIFIYIASRFYRAGTHLSRKGAEIGERIKEAAKD